MCRLRYAIGFGVHEWARGLRHQSTFASIDRRDSDLYFDRHVDCCGAAMMCKRDVAALIAGLIFAIGLVISGMTEPQKVIGFLDVTGQWDPSLAFVMIGAICVHGVSYWLIRKRASPVFDVDFHVSSGKHISKSLVIGAALFGIGWGLGGFCPGPAVVSLAGLKMRTIVFVVAMLAGMLVFKTAASRKTPDEK